MKELILLITVLGLTIFISGCTRPATSPLKLTTFEEVFAEVENIPKSTTSDFIEESRLSELKGTIIKETRDAPIECFAPPCDVESEKYDIYLFQDLVNKDYEIPMEEKYITQFSLEIGSQYVIKGNVIYLRTAIEVKVRRFEPIQVLEGI